MFKKISSTLCVSWRVINAIIIVVAFFAPWLSSGDAWTITLNGFLIAVFAGIASIFAVVGLISMAYEPTTGILWLGVFLFIFMGMICLGGYLITGFIGYLSSHFTLLAIGLLIPATCLIFFIAISFWEDTSGTLLWGYWLVLTGVISSIALEVVESSW